MKVDKLYYQNARKKIINYFSECDEVISVYEYGTLSAPGISDLDLILVLKKNIKDPNFYDFQNIDDKVFRLVKDGNVMKMNKNTFEQINFVDVISTKLLCGKKINIIKAEKNYIDMLKLVSISDWLPERLIRIHKIINKHKINIANSLCVLHSFNYSIKNIESLVGEIDGSKKFFKTVKQLRTNWHSIKDNKIKLLWCLNNAIIIGLLALDSFGKYLVNKAFFNSIDHLIHKFYEIKIYKDSFYIFNKNFHSKIKKENNFSVLAMNSVFYSHYFAISIIDTFISEMFRKKIGHNIVYEINQESGFYLNVLKKKVLIMSKNANFLINKKFTGGLLRYGFHVF